MNNSNFEDVQAFHHKFGVMPEKSKRRDCLHLLGHAAFDFRFGFLREELDEFKAAYEKGDSVEMIDALVDLVYVALGTADMMNANWQDHWNEVQRANMTKERAQSASDSKRGSSLDVIKPEGWTGPDHQMILENRGEPANYYDHNNHEFTPFGK